jgi:ribosomal protein S18 acetylase RimI-like enzyme
VRIRDLAPEEHDAAIALWHAAGLTRPWNDPRSDLERALAGPSSAVLVARPDDGSGLLGTVMVGHDGHRGWMYYLAAAERGRGVGRALAAAFYARLGYERSEVTVWQRVIRDDPTCPPSTTLLG